MSWTTGQNDVIRELGHKGVRTVHDALLERYGVDYSLHAIEIQASRIHASLRVRPVCPECGAVGVRINRQTGLCAACSERLHLAEAVAFNDVLLAEREELASDAEVEELRRENAAMRQRNARLCKKYGLPTARERRRVCDAGGRSGHYEKDEADIPDGGAGGGAQARRPVRRRHH